MASEKNAIKVGIVTILTITLFFVVLIWISKGVGGEMKTITMRFPAAAVMPRLAEGSDILVGGQKVGRVIDASLGYRSFENPKTKKLEDRLFVVVTAEVQSRIDLRSDCKAFPEAPPLGGAGEIKLDVGLAAQPLADGQVIEGAQPGGFGAVLASLQGELDGNNPAGLLGAIKNQLNPDAEGSLLAKILRSADDINVLTASLGKELSADDQGALLAKTHALADNINEMTASLRREFEPGNPAVVLGKVHSAMNAVNDGLETMKRLLANSEGPLLRTVTNVEKTSANVLAETDPRKTDSLIAQFKKAAAKINSSLDDINTVTTTTRTVVVLNRENINKLLVNFKEASDHIKTGVKYVLLHPWRLFNAPTPMEMQQQAIFDAARSFAEAATRLEDVSAHLHALSELHDGAIPGDDPDLKQIQTDLKQTRDKYIQAEAELWRLLNVN